MDKNSTKDKEKEDLQKERIFFALEKELGAEHLIKNAPMKEHTSFKAGGTADLLVIPSSVPELKQALIILAKEEMPYYIMGNGSNLLVRDGGYRGAIVKVGNQLAEIKREGNRIIAGAGALLSSVAAFAFEQELTGFEFASGIPGSLGGAAFMNAGAYGGEMKQVVEAVHILTKDGKEEKTLSLEELNYAYRYSSLMKNGDLVLSVTLRLQKGEREQIARTMRELTTKRNEKQPVCYPSAGSFFKRPEGYFAGQLIQEAGLMGVRVGGVSVSTLHAGFVINDKGGTATEILTLMKKIQDEVFAKIGVRLEPEVQIIGEE